MNAESQNLAIATFIHDAWLAAEGIKPHQRTDHDMLYGGHDSFGLWIYMRPDGSGASMNYDSEERLRAGEIAHLAKRNNYCTDMNALHNAWRQLSDQQKFQFRQELKLINAREGGWAEEILANFGAEALLRTIGRWIDEKPDQCVGCGATENTRHKQDCREIGS